MRRGARAALLQAAVSRDRVTSRITSHLTLHGLFRLSLPSQLLELPAASLRSLLVRGVTHGDPEGTTGDWMSGKESQTWESIPRSVSVGP